MFTNLVMLIFFYFQELTEGMGFSLIRAEKALYYSDNVGVENAVQWLTEHENDVDVLCGGEGGQTSYITAYISWVNSRIIGMLIYNPRPPPPLLIDSIDLRYEGT